MGSRYVELLPYTAPRHQQQQSMNVAYQPNMPFAMPHVVPDRSHQVPRGNMHIPTGPYGPGSGPHMQPYAPMAHQPPPPQQGGHNMVPSPGPVMGRVPAGGRPGQVCVVGIPCIRITKGLSALQSALNNPLLARPSVVDMPCLLFQSIGHFFLVLPFCLLFQCIGHFLLVLPFALGIFCWRIRPPRTSFGCSSICVRHPLLACPSLFDTVCQTKCLCWHVSGVSKRVVSWMSPVWEVSTWHVMIRGLVVFPWSVTKQCLEEWLFPHTCDAVKWSAGDC
jgi:hypothetical protein